MTLNTLHRVLIISGIVLGLLMVGFTLMRWLGAHDTSLVPTGIMGAIATVVLTGYLRWFNRKQPARG